MKIVRDGKEIELTNEELYAAHRIVERENLLDDITSKSEGMGKPITREMAETIVDRVDKAISNNDGYYECYWLSIQYVLEEQFKWVTVEAEVRISDAIDNEFLECKTFTFTAPEDKDGNDWNGYNDLFHYLFTAYPEDFPEEEPGVNAEIVNVTVIGEAE